MTADELAIARMAVEPVREVVYGFLKLSKGPPAAPNWPKQPELATAAEAVVADVSVADLHATGSVSMPAARTVLVFTNH